MRKNLRFYKSFGDAPTGRGASTGSVRQNLDGRPATPERQPDCHHVRGALQAFAFTLDVRRAVAPRGERDPAHLLIACAQRNDKRSLAGPVTRDVSRLAIGGAVQKQRGASRVCPLPYDAHQPFSKSFAIYNFDQGTDSVPQRP